MSYLNLSQETNINAVSEDFAAMDPTILAGYKIKFDKEVKIAIADSQNSQNEEIRIIRVRIAEKTENNNLSEVRIELEDNLDVGFFNECTITASEFDQLQSSNRLRVNFKDFTNSIKDLLEKSVKTPESYQLIFKQDDDYGGDLTFIQSLKLRRVVVFSLHFVLSPHDFIRTQVQYRFNKVKLELKLREDEIDTKFKQVKSRSPAQEKILRSSIEGALKKRNINK
ncbi:hypothetical protein TRFO_09876 [Tritrichomonas foetus]|uniref:Spindle assembly abnormal protein 6 N-terminal domain-containing protein n=1 Tax=Tritrichomonas foetus TaxID=1144522 RepID=A0A1J4JGX1_9EUKA|nr:hypothetical protein TRFO_09876 [Tritrichomonas foetus]|eukprot:OHS96500.1 hypothetical protein TRFO_09876 [Tritrichomonas foetus]